MPRKEENPNQICRIDGNKCFMEAMRNAFEIHKILLNFIQYDPNKQQGSKFTCEIPIYLDFKDFDNIFYEVMISSSIIKQINKLAVDPNKKEYEKQLIIYRGGTKKDGNVIAKQLKIFRGRKKPIVLRAEIGKGQENQIGGFSMVGMPERYIDIGMEYKDLEILLLEIWKSVNGNAVEKELQKKYDDAMFEIQKLKDMITLIARSLNINPQELSNIINREPAKTTYAKNQNPEQINNNNRNNGYANNNVNNTNYSNNGNNYPNNYGYGSTYNFV